MLAKYKSLLPIARKAARRCGYALAFHGSGIRDLDLVAAPWIEPAESSEELVEEIRRAVGGVIVNYENVERNPAVRPHGRKAWSIQVGGGRYIDLSVMPTVKKRNRKAGR